MAFILLKTNQTITTGQAQTIKSRIGQTMVLIGQSEDYLLLNLEDKQTLYLRGQAVPTAYIEVNIFAPDKTTFTAFAQTLTQITSRYLNIAATNIYIKFSELHTWSAGGQLIGK